MERRDFIKNLSLATTAPFILNGIPVNLMASNAALQMAAGSSDNDRVLVLIQLHGGNDGLNTLIPLDQYGEYYNLRPNIALPDAGSRKIITLDSTLPIAQQLGLHPDMGGIKQLYDQGKVSIVQGVTYTNNNQSHFRSRDIWFMGGSYNENYDSGWAGRLLDKEYPNYPASYPNIAMPDPLALEIGSAVSLLYHRNNGIPVAISISNPEQFYNLIQEVGNTNLPAALESTYYGNELKWIMEIEKKSDPYATQLKAIFDKGSNSVTYPELYNMNAPGKYLKNGLAPQLKLVARLLAGGIKTKIFLVKMGGFDTHANQVEKYNASFGGHSALLYHISSAAKAFQDDLKALGVEDRVLTATFSEFGRRPASNGSYGSDHGSAAPMFLFGKHVTSGVVGNNPNLSDLEGGNLKMQNDYRQVFHSVVDDWLKASPEAIAATGFDKYEKLNVISSNITSKSDFINERFYISNCEPNPAKSETFFTFKSQSATPLLVELFTIDGKKLKTIFDEIVQEGVHKIRIDLTELSAATYILKVDSDLAKAARKITVLK